VIRSLKRISINIAELQSTQDQQDTLQRVSLFFPSARGVVEFLAEDGSTILLAASGHIRSFVADRLNEDNEPNAKANLAPITAEIIAYLTGSALESDWIVHERARRVDPGLYTKLNEQNRRALLVLDRATGTWRVEETIGLKPNPNERVVGPILTNKAARALGETLDDVFELCRFPKELAQAPRGTPCAYKEMGRCPGACDGSEPMEAYHTRFGRAVEAAEMGVEQWRSELTNQINDASAAMDFERAQRAKRCLDQVGKLPIDALGQLGAMDRLALLCITPSVRKGWAMLWVLGRNGLTPLVTTNGETILDELVSMIESNQSPMGMDPISLDRFALVARHWMTKPARLRRRRVTILDLRHSCWRGKLKQAILDGSTPVELEHDDEEHTHIRG